MRFIVKIWVLGFSIAFLSIIVLNVSLFVPNQITQHQDTDVNFTNKLNSASDPSEFISVWDTRKSNGGKPTPIK